MLIRAMSEADVSTHWKTSQWENVEQLSVEQAADSSQATCGMYLGALWLLYLLV